METLKCLARYNAWANRRVFDACDAVPVDLLSEEARGTYGSVAETLKHLSEVEEIYLLMLQGQDPKSLGDDYQEHDTVWFSERSGTLGDEYGSLLTSHDASWLEGQFVVPWFGFPMTRRDGLLQVWMHSAQHRSQVLSELGSHGVDVPDIDYVYMLSLEQGAAQN
jgi:uncharacterized damage-inducible protein DinB